MRFIVVVNQKKCLEHGLRQSEGALMDILNQAPSWADEKVIENKVYYFVSRQKVTVYRAFKKLDDKGLVEYRKEGLKDFLRLTPIGKTWNKHLAKLGFESESLPNSDLNPTKLGFESEGDDSGSGPIKPNKTPLNSDLNPTYNNKYTIDNSQEGILKDIKKDFPIVYDKILSDESFHLRLMKRLKSEKINPFFEKDILPILKKWMCDNWTGDGLNSTSGKLTVKCTSYVLAVMKNGGLTDFKKQEPPAGPRPAYMKEGF